MTDIKSRVLEGVQDLYELFARLGSKHHSEAALREQAHFFLFAVIEGFQGAPARKIGTSAQEREFRRIAVAAQDMFYALEESHTSTRAILVKHLALPVEFNAAQKAAQKIFIAAGWGLKETLDSETTKTELGPPTQIGLANVTRLAAGMFKFLTNKRPTVRHRPIAKNSSTDAVGDYGPFIDFLKALFKILGIQASAESQAREYLGKSKAAASPNGH